MQANATQNPTVHQLNALIKLMTLHGSRIKTATVENGFLNVCYATQSGYFFVVCTYSRDGKQVDKKHFRGWDAETSQPIEPVNFKE